ncbi:hypothetical protein HAHE_27530 [Haloferula helveola]|uniref:Uncharacterized protein n=1 Tax=Haloferula helveola TaxID=490095 RepID=A0ABM7RM17_9BACT|nr:hypothetical protein HAHE_27530 [Haloferula helveola]
MRTAHQSLVCQIDGTDQDRCEQIEWHLRILSLIVNLAVCVLSLIGLWRKLRGRR